MGLTAEQAACVRTLDRSIVVAAGAGSGKTFTLTERIVHAFKEGYVRDIGEVCAITFTKKAAGELKSRIKAGLKANGFPDQALKVDDAWISTIHGMCARILRSNAVELGIDPAFSVAEGAQLDELLSQAVDRVLVESSMSGASEQIDRLFSAWPARSSGAYDESVESMLFRLVEKASANPRGLDACVLPGSTMLPAVAVAEAIDIVSALVEAAQAASSSASCQEWVSSASESLDAARAALDGGIDGYEEALGLIAPMKLKKGFGGKAFGALVDEAKPRLAACVMEMRLGLARAYLETLVDLASRALSVFSQMKRANGVLDNNDLLVLAARAIEEHLAIAARYTDKFKLIMVDEFQDTDQMQVDMIKRLAGEGAHRLCTVGDAQQSIYRFRGADVSVYRRHVASVGEASPESVMKLTANFRSHADVLAFVEFAFAQPSMFGGEFMPLRAGRGSDREDARFDASSSRITVLHTSRPYRGVSTDEMRAIAARRIAQEFVALKEAGHTAGEMVVLLGSMKHAGVYAEALRGEGFPCVISGGSVFSDTAEAKLVGDIVRVIANPLETQSLFNVLVSPLFAFSASDLLAVGGPKGFWRVDAQDETFDPRVACALRVMGEAREGRGRLAVSHLVERVVVDSGWLSRLERRGPEGLAAAGNVYKAIRMVADIERDAALGPVSVMRHFEAALASSKEAPGALSVSGGDSVRIMTVHSSKGLEFPIVAVAEFRDDKEDSSSLIAAEVNGDIYLSLDAPSNALRNAGDWIGSAERKALGEELLGPVAGEEELASMVARDGGALLRRLALVRYNATGEAEEAKRLLYVALTRAKEALVVSTMAITSKEDPVGAPKNAFIGIHEALGHGAGLTPGRSLVDFGGQKPAVVECVVLAAEDIADEEVAVADEHEAFQVPMPPLERRGMPREVLRSTHEGVFSYSSVSDASHEGDLLARLAASFAVHADAPATGAVQPACDCIMRRTDACAIQLGVGARQPAREYFGDDVSDFDASSLYDQDRATDLGTAFHRLAQYAVIARSSCGDGADDDKLGELAMPPAERIESLSRTCNLDTEQRARLAAALERWFGSTVAHDMAALPMLAAEVPFFVAVENGANGEGCSFLEGEIDLLGFDEERVRAYVVDYKTGGSDDEAPDELERKHVLQASCYAYAILLQGIESVDAVFVRVERPCASDPHEPQCVRYHFEKADLPVLVEAISSLAPTT